MTETTKGTMLILHLLVNTKDAMGANAVNTMAEAVAPMVELITEGKVNLRIISNLADRRLVRVRARFKNETIGGGTKANPVASLSLKIMNVQSAEELAGVIAATGLAQNFAALKALATDGIQKGHMALHGRNLAAMAGANENLIDIIVKRAIEDGNVSYDHILAIKNEIQEE